MICGKVTYKSRNGAQAAIRGLSVDKGVTRSRKQANKSYFCKPCDGWHLFTEGKKKRIYVRKNLSEDITTKERTPVENLVIHTKMKIK